MDVEELRLAVYRTFAHGGRPPTPVELAGELGWSPEQVHEGWARWRRLGISRSMPTGAS